MANSAAVLAEAFPPNQRGFALGLNGVIGIFGGVFGIILGGVLASIYWRDVFLVSVPLGIIGTIWSYKSLKQLTPPNRNQKIDITGNILYAISLILVLIGITYGILPYGSAATGWSNPYVIASITSGLILFGIFLFIESKVKDPMFRLDLFKVRAFTMASLSVFFAQIAFGGLQLMLVLWLQAIWLPIHGIPYSEAPFWAGIYLLPLLAGFGIMGSIAGRLSDKYGARVLATLGLVILGVGFIALTMLPYNFNYLVFATIIFIMGIGNGLFVSPNMAALINSAPPQHRGSASGIRAMLTNTGGTLSIGLAFTIVIEVLYLNLPSTLSSALTAVGAPQLIPFMTKIPPTAALFSAFLGYNPVSTILSQLPQNVVSSIPASAIQTMTGKFWFPSVIAPAFMDSLRIAFYFSATLVFVAAVISALRGKTVIYERDVINTLQEEKKT